MSYNNNQPWYDTLKKSPLTPPTAVFPVAWTILYLMIFCSFFIYLGSEPTIMGLTVFIISLLLNFSWSPVFFRARKIGLSLIIIILMWLSIIATIFQVGMRSQLSARLLYPYLAWVTFATYLNAYIWWNN